MSTVYGVINSQGVHVDVADSERGAKVYATKNGYTQVTARENGGYHAHIIAHKVGKMWRDGAPEIVREDAPAADQVNAEDNRRTLAVKTVGEYMTRDGRRVTVTHVTPGNGGNSVKGLVWDATPNGFKPSIRFMWHESGKYSVLNGVSPFDIVARWDMSKQPFEVTGPGEYLLRNGMRVTVDEVRTGTPYTFKVKGRIWKKFRGKVRARRSEVWMITGHINAVGQSEMDIVAPFTGGSQHG